MRGDESNRSISGVGTIAMECKCRRVVRQYSYPARTMLPDFRDQRINSKTIVPSTVWRPARWRSLMFGKPLEAHEDSASSWRCGEVTGDLM